MQTNRFATQHITWRERTTAHSELILLICANPHEGMGSYFVHYWLPPCLPVPHSLIHYKLAAHLAELLLYCCTIQCSPRKEEEHESKNKRLKHRKCINWPVMSTIKVKVCTTRCTKNGGPSSGTSLLHPKEEVRLLFSSFYAGRVVDGEKVAIYYYDHH